MINNMINYLKKEIDEEKISHAFLVSTNNARRVKDDISSFLQKKQIISSQSIKNNISVKNIYPDNNLIDKNKILDLQKFIITKSIINKYKVYFIINAEFMNTSSFNKILKILEEPTENVIGFLITEDDSSIIPTIKSRCKRFSAYYSDDKNNNYELIINKLKNIKELQFLEIIILKKEIMKHEKQEILNIINEYKKYILNETTNINQLKELANSYKVLDNINSLIQSNVNIELCLDKMFIEMRK